MCNFAGGVTHNSSRDSKPSKTPDGRASTSMALRLLLVVRHQVFGRRSERDGPSVKESLRWNHVTLYSLFRDRGLAQDPQETCRYACGFFFILPLNIAKRLRAQHLVYRASRGLMHATVLD